MTPSPIRLILASVVLVTAALACSTAGDMDEGPLEVVQGPGSKSAEDEQARIDARLPGRLTEARVFHTGTVLADGRVLVTGGKGLVIRGAPTEAVEIFDPETRDWTMIAELPLARENHRAALLNDGRVLITGGRGSNSNPMSGVLFDPDSDTWSKGASMDSGRLSHTATVLPDGRVLWSPEARWRSTWMRPRSTIRGRCLESRGHHVRQEGLAPSDLLADGRVLITGGKRAGTPAVAEVEIFDPATGEWAAGPQMATARSSHSASLLPDGRVLVVGGYGADKDPVSSSEIFDPA